VHARVAGIANLVDDVDHHAEAFERKIFALQRNDNLVGNVERIHEKDAERRRAIHHNKLVEAGFNNGIHGLLETVQIVVAPGNGDFRPGEVELGRDDVEILDARFLDQALTGGFAQQRREDARSKTFLKPQSASGVGLRIKVDQQHLLALFRKAG